MKRQSGFGLMVMLIVIVLAGTYVIVSKLSATATSAVPNANWLEATDAMVGQVVFGLGPEATRVG